MSPHHQERATRRGGWRGCPGARAERPGARSATPTAAPPSCPATAPSSARSATGDLAASLGWSWQLDAASRLIGASSGVGSDFRQGYGEADQLVTLARDDTGDAAEISSRARRAGSPRATG